MTNELYYRLLAVIDYHDDMASGRERKPVFTADVVIDTSILRANFHAQAATDVRTALDAALATECE